MNVLIIFFTIAAAYFLAVFVLLRLVVPFMGFGGLVMPMQIPDNVRNKITDLENGSSSQEEYLKNAYDFVVRNWHAGRLDTIFYAPLAFRKNLGTLLAEPGYAHCNTQNYLLFVLLGGSKFFKAGDVKARYVFFNFFVHQYLLVKIGDKTIDVDPAGASIRGKQLGYHLSFFG